MMKKFLFKFSFFYFILILDLTPFSWLNNIPGFSGLSETYFHGEAFLVESMNDSFFNVAEELNINGAGSGDTSYAWARFYTIIFLSMLLAILWSLIEKKDRSYELLAYALRIGLRYYIALVAFGYGIIKVFSLQMPFPNLSQLATPLGDFLPMRLSWMFLGYSSPYQIFSGVMEVLICILLFNRKTVTAGLIIGFAVFSNVFILNLSYDIPVKLYAFQLLMAVIYLLAEDGKRLLNLFGFNSAVGRNSLYDDLFSFRFYDALRISSKILFFLLFVMIPSWEAWTWYQRVFHTNMSIPVYAGLYQIDSYVVNGDTVLLDQSDKTQWHDLILDKGNTGSIQTTDSRFINRYGRGYFGYTIDSASNQISFTKSATDTTTLMNLNFQFSDSLKLHLWGRLQNDSIDYRFIRSNRYFQLTEKQFHWISEANR